MTLLEGEGRRLPGRSHGPSHVLAVIVAFSESLTLWLTFTAWEHTCHTRSALEPCSPNYGPVQMMTSRRPTPKVLLMPMSLRHCGEEGSC